MRASLNWPGPSARKRQALAEEMADQSIRLSVSSIGFATSGDEALHHHARTAAIALANAVRAVEDYQRALELETVG
jgi:hypothetical protein